jgi:hypothetical protein
VRGFKLRELRVETRDDYYEMNFGVYDQAGVLTVVLRLPRPDASGIYDIEGVHKTIIREGRRGADYPARPNATESIWVLGQEEILQSVIHRALDNALVSAVHGNPPGEQVGQDTIDKWFARPSGWPKVPLSKVAGSCAARSCCAVL